MGKRQLTHKAFLEAAVMLKALAHPDRIRIVELLAGGDTLSVNQIAKGAGLKQSITSQHLKLLKNGGALDSHKLSNQVFYSLYKKELLKLLACIKNCCGRERK